MERDPNKTEDLKQSHEENRQTESEIRREDMNPPTPDTEQKKDGTTSAFSAATGGNRGNDGAVD